MNYNFEWIAQGRLHWKGNISINNRGSFAWSRRNQDQPWNLVKNANTATAGDGDDMTDLQVVLQLVYN